jgi:hypothetical protein
VDTRYEPNDIVRSTSNGQLFVIQEFTMSYETFGPAYIARPIDGGTTVLLTPTELRPLEALEILAVADQIKSRMSFMSSVLDGITRMEINVQ